MVGVLVSFLLLLEEPEAKYYSYSQKKDFEF